MYVCIYFIGTSLNMIEITGLFLSPGQVYGTKTLHGAKKAKTRENTDTHRHGRTQSWTPVRRAMTDRMERCIWESAQKGGWQRSNTGCGTELYVEDLDVSVLGF